MRNFISNCFNKPILVGLVILLLCTMIVGILRVFPAKYVLPRSDEVRAVYIYSRKGYDGYDLMPLRDQDRETLFTIIENVSLCKGSAHSPTEYTGMKLWMFRFEYVDGSYLDFAASLPLFIINGTEGFDADFDGNASVCSGISNIYYELVKTYFG